MSSNQMFYRYNRRVSLAFMIFLLNTFADCEDSRLTLRGPTSNDRTAKLFPNAAKEKPQKRGCKDLEGGKKYLVSDIGEMLARCLNCGPSFGSAQSVGVHGKRGDTFAQWTFEPIGDKCAIKSDIGAYAGRCNGCWRNGAYPDSLFNHVETASPDSPYSLWEVEKHGDSYSFKADTGNYLARCRGCVPGGAKNDFAFVHATSPTGPALWDVLSAEQSS